MGIGRRIGRTWRAVALVAVGAVGAGAAIAVASVPDSSGVIHACVNTVVGGGTANVRVIDTGAGQQCDPASGETTLNWNVTGPQGQIGPQGLPGANGRSATITAGNTITIGGSVITVGQSRGITIAAPTISGNGIGTMTLSGGLSLTTPILGVSFASQQPGSGHGTGKNSFHDLTVTRELDKSSAKLSLACANGTHIKEVVIKVGKAGKEIDYDLKEALIASYALSSAKSQFIETMTLNFASETIKAHK